MSLGTCGYPCKVNLCLNFRILVIIQETSYTVSIIMIVVNKCISSSAGVDGVFHFERSMQIFQNYFWLFLFLFQMEDAEWWIVLIIVNIKIGCRDVNIHVCCNEAWGRLYGNIGVHRCNLVSRVSHLNVWGPGVKIRDPGNEVVIGA